MVLATLLCSRVPFNPRITEMNESQTNELRSSLLGSLSVQDSCRILDEVRKAHIEGILSEEDYAQLLLTGLYRLKILTEGDRAGALYALPTYLVPALLGSSESEKDSLFQNRCRHLLQEWINQYEERDRIPLRLEILKLLSKYLDNPETTNQALLSIGTIGLREESIFSRILQMAQLESEHSDTALYIATTLRPPTAEAEWIDGELRKRIDSRMNWQLIEASRNTPSSGLLQSVLSHWFVPSEIKERNFHRSIALRIMTTIADREYTNLELQDHIWKEIVSLLRSFPEAFAFDFTMGSDLAPSIDSPAVPLDLLNLLGAGIFRREERFGLYHRLLECIRPRQLDGWEQLLDTNALEILLSDARNSTGHESSYSWTKEGYLKDLAWNCLLRKGYHDLLLDFDAIANESDALMQHNLCKYVACFPNASLEEPITQWAEQLEQKHGKIPNILTIAIIGAISVLQSVYTPKALQLLTSEKLMPGGHLLKQHVDSVARVAEHLANQGFDSIDLLLKVALNNESAITRECSIGALARLKKSLPNFIVSQLSKVVLDEDLSAFSRAVVITMLAPTDVEVEQTILERFYSWALQETESLGWASFEFLAHRGLLANDSSLMNVLERRFGTDAAASYIYSLLYEREPHKWEGAITRVFENLTWESVYPVLNMLRRMYAHGNPIPDKIQEAMIQRMLKRSTQYYAEPPLILFLGRLIPEHVLKSIGTAGVTDWLPETRVALANAMGGAAQQVTSLIDTITAQLVRLCGDANFRVRRAAYRNLSTLSQKSLLALVEMLSQGRNSCDIRKRGAEASAWISEDARFSNFHELLSTDVEPSVRAQMSQSWIERRQRKWARLYESILTSNQDFSVESILKLWKYGKALEKIGDDLTLAGLRRYYEDTSIPPHGIHWLESIIDALEKQETEQLSKLSEQWTPEEASIDQKAGELIVGTEKLSLPTIFIWQSFRPTPYDQSSWGGSIVWQGNMKFQMLISETSECTVKLEDKRSGTAIIRRITQDHIVFTGSGEFK